MPVRPRRPGRLARAVVAVVALVLLAAIPGLPPTHAQKPAGCEYQGVERVVAVADVHGAYDRYLEILRVAGVIDERRHWTGGRTHFVQLGDIVDRGAQSRKVLDFLRDLEGPARRAGGKVHVLLGNHEVMRMLGDLRYVAPGEYEAFVTPESRDLRQRYLRRLPEEERARVEPTLPLGWVEMRVAFGQAGQYGSWLHKLDTVVRLNEVLFVHGGLSPEVSQMRCDAINDTVRRELSTEIDKTRAAPLKSLVASENGPLWYRGLAQESPEFEAKLDEILANQGAKAIVVGHTIQQDGRIQKRFGGKVFALDTGMQPAYLPSGRAAALEIVNGTFTAIYADRREVLVKHN